MNGTADKLTVVRCPYCIGWNRASPSHVRPSASCSEGHDGRFLQILEMR
jgi:hypothetical protein